MKYCHYFKSGTGILQSIRRLSKYSDDPGKAIYEKGLSEENRYFLKKQQEELRQLRKQLDLMAKFQTKLDRKLQKSQKAIKDLINKQEQKKE